MEGAHGDVEDQNSTKKNWLGSNWLLAEALPGITTY